MKIMALMALLIVGTWTNALSQVKADAAASGIVTDATTGKATALASKSGR